MTALGASQGTATIINDLNYNIDFYKQRAKDILNKATVGGTVMRGFGVNPNIRGDYGPAVEIHMPLFA